jgi:hypothetical protein
MAPMPRAKVKCPVCGTDYGDLVTACPKCGAMNPGHRSVPATTSPPAAYEPPPPPPVAPLSQPGYYQAGPPPPQYGAPPPGYPAYGAPPPGAYPPGQYPPGYGPQPRPASGLAMVGIFFALGAFISMMIGAMLFQPVCGVSAVVCGIIGLIIGLSLIGKQPQQAKMIISFSAIALVTTLIIVIMVFAILG